MAAAVRRAVVSITVDGQVVTDAFEPRLVSLTIRLTDGGKSDSLDITLEDTDGMIKLPREGADIEALIFWSDGGGAVQFAGKTDEPTSEGSRGGGRLLHILATAADMKGKPKAKKSRHKDKGKFSDVAQQWGDDAGLDVKVDEDLSKIERPYWSMANESFMAWGERIAREIGATFKIGGRKAAFVPRNSGRSASGKDLTPISAVYGDNLISWRLSPIQNRARFKESIVRWYDPKEAKYKRQKVKVEDLAQVDLVDTAKAPDQDHADRKASANADEAKRGKGGGSVTIDGEPAAQAQATCTVSGARPGIDGDYRVATASHTYSRGGGWITELDLEQPDGAAGSDPRSASKAK